MSESHQTIVPSGFFVLRTPLMSFDVLESWSGNLGGSDSSNGDAIRTRLRDVFASPVAREALFIASPDLDARFDCWWNTPDSEAGRKMARALVRYIARMTARATPFGLFAGCSVGTIGRCTRLHVTGSGRRHTRLDMDYVVALTDALTHEPALQADLRFVVNSSLYRIPGRLRYLEIRRKDKDWVHQRVALDVPSYLEVVLARANGGATKAELVAALQEHDPEASTAEAVEYLTELIGQQVLVSELVPTVTGPEPIHGLIARLQQLSGGEDTAETLAEVRNELIALDSSELGANPARYRGIASRLSTLPAPVDNSRLFQVDVVKPADATLGQNVVAEITRGMELLRRITPRLEGDPLATFRDAFIARFGDTPVTREIPLAEALDDETGVGFGDGGTNVEASSLLEGLKLSPPAPRQLTWGTRETFLLGRLTEALARGQHEISLTKQDIEELAVENPLPLPDALATLVRLEAPSNDAVDRGDFRLFLAIANGPSGARLLGRFSHSDPELAMRVAEHLRAEEALRPDAVFAEIVHLPEGRMGNLLARPTDRHYEIPYLGRSGLPNDRQLPVSDLRVSVVGARVVLRSVKLGREVLPRLTSAHNFTTSQGVYRFLCALQGQDVADALSWDWGPLADSAFLPRVTHGRLVLARMQWSVTAADAKELLSGGEEERFTAVQNWRQIRRLPRWICLADHDNELPIDLDNQLMVETLLGQMKGQQRIALVELFPAPGQMCATGPDGHLVHELVVPFIEQPDTRASQEGHLSAPIGQSTPSFRRLFPPGSEWLTIKLYGGTIAIDHIVRDVVGPLAAELVTEGFARRWFFVRYADPHNHLRLRFQGGPTLLATALQRVQEAVESHLADGRIWKVQLDTYEREVERFGGPTGIGPCEQIFNHDSDATFQLLRLLDHDTRGEKRWRLVFLGMHRLLEDLGLNLDGKRRVLQGICASARARVRDNREAIRWLSAKYRVESGSLAKLIDPEASTEDEWRDAREIFNRRSLSNIQPVAMLCQQSRTGHLSSPISDFASSLLHMHANRLLRSAHLQQEMVVYEFLARIYEWQALRGSETGGLVSV